MKKAKIALKKSLVAFKKLDRNFEALITDVKGKKPRKALGKFLRRFAARMHDVGKRLEKEKAVEHKHQHMKHGDAEYRDLISDNS